MQNFYKRDKDYLILRKEAVKLFYKGLKCTEIAKKLVCDRHAVGRWLRKAGCEYSKVNKANINSHIFNNIDSEEKAYWLGFLFADGYVSKNTEFELSLGLKDINHLEKFKTFLNYEGKIKIDNKIGRCRLQFGDPEIVNNLKDIGCVNKKSLILEFPEKLSENLYSHFIRGYFDGDGSINNPISPISITIIGTYPFIEKIHSILFIPIDSIKHRNPKHSELVFTNILSGQTARNFCEYIYKEATIFLERKYNRYVEHLNNFNTWDKGVDIEILDNLSNQIYKFNRYKNACKFMNCSYYLLVKGYENNIIIKKRYRILKYDKHKRNTSTRICREMDK